MFTAHAPVPHVGELALLSIFMVIWFPGANKILLISPSPGRSTKKFLLAAL